MPPKKLARGSRKGFKLRQWTQEAMDEALRAVRSGTMGLVTASKEFGITRNTIADRFYNRVNDHCEHIGRKTSLTDQSQRL